jgi:hypothetical protein
LKDQLKATDPKVKALAAYRLGRLAEKQQNYSKHALTTNSLLIMILKAPPIWKHTSGIA